MLANIDKDLIQDLVNVYIHKGLSPISAQIFAFIKFDFEGNGVTFDQLYEALGVSKGSISLNLRTLLDKGLVQEFNIFSDRKRYFTINPDFILKKLKSEIETLEFERNTILKLLELGNQKGEWGKKNLAYINIHLELIESNINNLYKGVKKLEEQSQSE